MWVSQVLGHQDPALTLRTYAHVLERENDDMGFFEAGSNIRDDPGQEDSVKFVSSWKCGDPGAIRTRDPQLRRLGGYLEFMSNIGALETPCPANKWAESG
jgi:hypothetical protein